jgi:transaldolase
LYQSSRFEALRKKGAMVQRPLWASTGTKNPKFSPVMYVEELAGKDTVNTMPPATLKALLDNANIAGDKLRQDVNPSQALVDKIVSMGIAFPKLLVDLQVAGVKSFSDSFKELLDSIEKKRGQLI